MTLELTWNYSVHKVNDKDREEALTLELLAAVDGGDSLTQRHLAQRLGVALGLANLYVKRCVRKGLIKIKLAPANRYFYYLTRKGFAEKSRLTAKYLSHSFEFYRQAALSCVEVFQTCAANGRTRVLLCGVSELAEIASLRAREHGITLLGTYDPRHAEMRFLDLPVWQRVEDLPPCDFYVVTQLDGITEFVEALGNAVPRERILTPALLKVAPPSASLEIRAHRVTVRGHGARDAEG